MLIPPSPNDAARLRGFLAGTGYSEPQIREVLGLAELPSGRLRNQTRLLARTQEPTPLNTLLRWFWVGSHVPRSQAEGCLPPWFLTLVLDCGLLKAQSELLVPEAMLVPVDGMLIASDHTSRIDSTFPELVLWPNPTSRLLSRFTIRRKSQATFDLGTGNGIQALAASGHSEKVVATDLNARAIKFAEFNVRLSGLNNVECLVGDGFAPVAGRTFDLIVSNPPFFITPSDRYLFCDNPMGLDFLCRRLVREAPAFLNEGGYFQMLCEWAQVRGQTWQERLTEWLEGSGCDAWIMKGLTQDPSEYALERIRETNSSSDQDAELYANYMNYYGEKNVEAIHDGIIAIRRRSGHNWVLMEEVPHTPKEPFGESVLLTFAARDFLESHDSDEKMLSAKPKLSPHAQLEQFFHQAEGGWEPASLTLRLTKGFPFFLGLQSLVVEFLGGCDGNKTLGELTDTLAAKVSAPPEQVRKECLGIVRKLVERGFLLC